MITPTEKTQLMASMNVLGQELIQQAQQAHGNLMSKTQHAVSISDPQIRQQVQDKLDHAVNLLAIANVMAIFERHLPKEYWARAYRDPTITKQLRAFRHIRFCAANGFTGLRASENKTDFDKEYLAGDLPNWISSCNQHELFVKSGAAEFVFQVIRRAWERGIVAIHSM